MSRIPHWLRRQADRTEAARRAAEEASADLARTKMRWPEVRRRAEWARMRERENHLTELFHESRRGRTT